MSGGCDLRVEKRRPAARVILREPERSDRRPKDRSPSRGSGSSTALDRGQRSFVASLLRMTRGGRFAPPANRVLPASIGMTLSQRRLRARPRLTIAIPNAAQASANGVLLGAAGAPLSAAAIVVTDAGDFESSAPVHSTRSPSPYV